MKYMTFSVEENEKRISSVIFRGKKSFRQDSWILSTKALIHSRSHYLGWLFDKNTLITCTENSKGLLLHFFQPIYWRVFSQPLVDLWLRFPASPKSVSETVFSRILRGLFDSLLYNCWGFDSFFKVHMWWNNHVFLMYYEALLKKR